MGDVVFDNAYYERVMRECNYDPLSFERIDFSLGTLGAADLQRRWLCHHGAREFASLHAAGKQVLVTTGFGLSGAPHAGTLGQILRSLVLQKAGVPVQIVLGDLDAYNGKSVPLSRTRELATQYKEFISALGFTTTDGSVLRDQYSSLDVLLTAYEAGNYLDDALLESAEEDLHAFYSSKGKVDDTMSYRRKLSFNLMIGDFIHAQRQGNSSVLVMLGIDEHKYVQVAREAARRMNTGALEGMYTPIIKGFFGYPKMSKSFPESGITVEMKPDDIRARIMNGEGNYTTPENNVVYQMMAAASTFTPGELSDCYAHCAAKNAGWQQRKEQYVDMLIDICGKWKQ